MIDYERLQRDFDRLHAQYHAAQPFPHLVMDGLFRGDELAAALDDWPSYENSGWKTYQRGKRAFTAPGLARPNAALLMRCCNHRKFVEWLAALSGIGDLMPDHELQGGGLHDVATGGALGIHVDFNRSGSLYRRLNVLLYLNRGWQPEWHGQLELRQQAREVAGRVVIEPAFNRLVIFEASEHSWHGHPEPIACPEHVSRKSCAWYYYSRNPHPTYEADHSTVYVR